MLHVLDSFSFGGAENLVVELARHAAADPGADLDLAVASLGPRGREGKDAMLGRLQAVGLAPTYLGVRRLLDPLGVLRLARTLRAGSAEVVHAHLGYSATLVPLAARLAGVPCVATLHLEPQLGSRADRVKEALSVLVPARLGRLVLVSQAAYDGYARHYGPATASWRCIPNGIDVDRWTTARRRLPQDVPVPDGAPVWAVVAALREPKGHVPLVQAWARVVEDHPDAHLLVVGEGPHRSALEMRVHELGLGRRVHLLGRREDVPDLLAGVDGVVSASFTEALPTALVEAAACGLPVVATDAGGTRDVVLDGVTGRVVPVGDVTALATELSRLLSDPRTRAAYGAAARRRAEQVFSMQAWTRALHDLYAELVVPSGTDPKETA
ncbi:glycosyltransferase [Arsenicicoccus sp. MKL-02]|uniref:Glycosyltransferase n=1 Tax=Arsenicicoccus cauae TaxID=2663847 RepID=A0A6I3IE11_9MICO|nr:glycosyltransferase [Arsenicicoccus cauae]